MNRFHGIARLDFWILSVLPCLALILFVADLFQPVNRFAVELFLYGDVRYGRRGCSTMPMLFARRNPDHVARPNFLDWGSPALCPATTSRHNQSLAQWVGVPRRPGAGLEGDTDADNTRRSRRGDQWIDTHRASEPLGGSLAGWL